MSIQNKIIKPTSFVDFHKIFFIIFSHMLRSIWRYQSDNQKL